MATMQVLTPEQIIFFKERAKLAANAKGLEILDSDVLLTPEGKVKVVSHYAPSSIERVRRVTGYFCKLSNCNEAKLQEISHRVKHEVCGVLER
ncbi:MAG: anaerobic ribonucleoside-triphosphate reductase [Firmicutes bacterium]|nr:anaerobic ribonucleoside-triphosphate reductase [Bacillota bacterium]